MTGATALEAVLTGRYAHRAHGVPTIPKTNVWVEAVRTRQSKRWRRATDALGRAAPRRRRGHGLAQQAPVALLDEPTNHLDPQHQLTVLEVFAAQARAGGAVIASLHDPTLAARHRRPRALMATDAGRRRGAAAGRRHALARST